MALKNFFKDIKNKFSTLKKLRQTELQTKYLAYHTALKHLKELQATHSLHPTKELELEIVYLDKKVVKINMEFVSFYENKRKKALIGFQKELDKVSTEEN